VGTNEIDDGAVTEVKIFDGAVTNTKLGPEAVTADKIRENTITNLQIGPRAVDTGELADSAVTSLKLANLAVTTAKIADRNVTTAKIAARAVTSVQVADKTLSDGQISSTYPAFAVSRGLEVGVGLVKSGNTVSARSHTHTYAVFTRDSDGEALTSSTPRNTSSAQYSTKRLKKNISNHKIVDPKKLLQLDLKKFKYKRSAADAHYSSRREWMHGYLLEDLIALGFDEVVYYDKEGTPEKLDYGLFSTLVLELVKVQQQEIQCLTGKIKKLEKK
jgi:hypothetical protein